MPIFECIFLNQLSLCVKFALEWSSFTEVDEHFKQATDVKLMIRLIFQKLEKVHGRTFISKALSLLTAAKEGISVVELEGIATR